MIILNEKVFLTIVTISVHIVFQVEASLAGDPENEDLHKLQKDLLVNNNYLFSMSIKFNFFY